VTSKKELGTASVDRLAGSRNPVKYVVVIERSENNYSAYVPDLPGCIATADTREEVLRSIREAIALHIELMHERGMEVPEPTSEGTTVELDTATS
jgi:predicted RNase H-like HicB family nuclease